MSMAGSPTLTAHVYPWDIVGDPAAPSRLLDSGVRRVALAGAYHAVRAATPRHPRHRIVEAPRSALYLPVRPQRWAGQQLAPVQADAWAGPDSFRRARDILAEAGIRVAGWIVLTHRDELGDTSHGHLVENAAGDLYRYALCPRSSDVRRFAATVTAEVVELGDVDELVVEAAGQLGFEHAAMHEKTQGTDWGSAAHALLSICFCPHCTQEYATAGVDIAGVRARILASLDDDRAAAELLRELAPTIARTRSAAAHALLADVVTTARDVGVRDITVFADPDPLVTGATMYPENPVMGIDRWLLPAFGDPDSDAARAGSMARLSETPVAAYVTLLSPDFAGSIDRRLAALHASGISSVHGYHYGLASQRRIDTMTAALARSPYGRSGA